MNEAGIYLDYAASAPLDKRVLEAMQPYQLHHFGNASGIHHFALPLHEAADTARNELAQMIGANASEIVYTSSATEANNLALKGIAATRTSKGKHLIVSAIEHASVYQSARFLETQGFEISWIPVSSEGRIDLDQLESLIKPETFLASVMHVNNETGAIQDLQGIGQICHRHGVLVHTDAAQSFAKLPLDVYRQQIDLLSASSHKIYGPFGAGLLFIREGIDLQPQLHGGGQEDGRRSSTLNVPALVGFGRAAHIFREEGNSEQKRIKNLKLAFLTELGERIPESIINGNPDNDIPNILNVSFPGCDAELLAMQLDSAGIAISTGAACSSGSIQVSRVLQAYGFKANRAKSAIRFSFGRFTTEKEIDYVLEKLPNLIQTVRKIS